MPDNYLKQINGKYYYFDPNCNESFILTAQELKTAGIKNYYFMLEVRDPRVIGIDPFKPNITKQEVALLLQEYRNNLWYFMRTGVRMRTGMGVVPYCLHRGLCAVSWLFLRHQDNCLCEPRQTYKTSGTLAGPIQWAFQLSHDCKMHFFGKETENTERNLATLKEDIAELPKWLQFKTYMAEDGKVKKSIQNVKRLENPVMHNTIMTHPKATSLSHAQGLARGGSGSILYFDEAEHTTFFSEILANSAPLFKTAAENAARAGTAYARLLSCTPGNLDTKEGREVYPIIKSMIPWTERMYDMSEAEITDYKQAFIEDYHETNKNTGREVVDIIYIEYQYFQLRRDYSWVLEQFKLSGDKNAIRREILLQRIRGSNANPISPEDINYLVANMRKATRDLLIDGKWLFKIYDHDVGINIASFKELDPNIPYLVGVDPAGGDSIKGDNFAITIVNPYNLKIAAEFKSPYLTGPNAARLLTHLIDDYIPRGVLCIERNSVGQYLIQMLAETHIVHNMYWDQSRNVVNTMNETTPDDNNLKQLSQTTQKYGRFVNAATRKLMFEKLFEIIRDAIGLLTTENLVNDLCTLVRYPNDKIAADSGEHDDCLMSYLHAIYTYFVGDNLPFFGIFKEEHPLLFGMNREKDLDEEEIEKAITATKEEEVIDYDQEVIAAAAYREEYISELQSSLSFYKDSAASNSNSVESGNVSIGAWYFDTLNV